MKLTFFASPERANQRELAEDLELINNNPVMTGLLESIGGLLAILNSHRQIISLNAPFLKFLGIDDPFETLGLRPGEAVNCIHAHDNEAGCGTGKACATCGAAIAIVTSLEEDRPTTQNCALTLNRKEEEIDISLQVRAQPIRIDKSRYLLLFVQDITLQQQRAALERTFYHDINNMLSGLAGASQLLIDGRNPERMAQLIRLTSLRMMKEIEIQRCLSQSEIGSYSLQREEVSTDQIKQELVACFDNHPAAVNKQIDFIPSQPPIHINTDISLVIRTLSNMVTNALEASAEQDGIRIWFEHNEDDLTYFVWNRQEIPEEITLRIFQRHFTTKNGDGRGLGTYSMKLFGEHVLGGKVAFTSSAREGTIFTLSLPRGQTPGDRLTPLVKHLEDHLS